MSEENYIIDGPDDAPAEPVAEVVQEAEPVEEAPEPTPDAATPPAEPTAEEVEAARIRDAAFKAREAKREAREERQKREELERKLAELTAPVRPDIPDYPDPYDENYAEKVRHRDAMIAQAARWDAQQAQAEQHRQWQAQEEQRKQQEELHKTAQDYSRKAVTLGVSGDELRAGGEMMVRFGVPQEIMTRILRDDRGPEITAYLGKNPDALGTLIDMHPMDAAVYLETVVKPNSKRTPPPVVPPPAQVPDGAGFREGERGPKGVTYY